MIVFLNGKFVPENRAVVSVFDRGFLYGDALFEGMLVTGGKPFRWREHMERLQRGVEFVKFTIPYSYDELETYAAKLIEKNRMPECMLRLSITRGITGRTYSPRNAVNPAVVMSLHPTPVIEKMPRWPVIIPSLRLMANDPLMEFKSTNKLRQVLARAEADDAGAKEAVLLNTKGHLAEGTTSNVFWVKDNVVYTPVLSDSALPGVTRSVILELCVKLKIDFRVQSAGVTALRHADGAFLTMTSMGLVEIESVDGHKIGRSPLVKKLWSEYRKLLNGHCRLPPVPAKATRPSASPSRSNRG